MNEGYFIIEDADDFAFSFESPEHFEQWLLEAHELYIFEEIEQVKELFIYHELFDYYMICKKFEDLYL